MEWIHYMHFQNLKHTCAVLLVHFVSVVDIPISEFCFGELYVASIASHFSLE